jgi:lysyl-tRNA synthetase class 2
MRIIKANGDKRAILLSRHILLRAVREFFWQRGYLEVETPHLMVSPAPEAHIDPLEVTVGNIGPYYLHTSPEMGMKKALAGGCERIFQVCKVFRREELEEVHSVEFTMVEWYGRGTYREGMKELADLVRCVADALGTQGRERFEGPWKAFDLASLFEATVSVNPFGLSTVQFRDALRAAGFGGVDGSDSWNDLFFKVLIQRIEPAVRARTPCYLTGWPLSISSMAKRKDADTVERFELYIDGLEIANGYTELLDRVEQQERFIVDLAERARRGMPAFPVDKTFLDALGRIQGPLFGVSAGLDRLLMAILDEPSIDGVLIDRVRLGTPSGP